MIRLFQLTVRYLSDKRDNSYWVNFQGCVYVAEVEVNVCAKLNFNYKLVQVLE